MISDDRKTRIIKAMQRFMESQQLKTVRLKRKKKKGESKMKERFILPREIQKQSEEFMDLMDTFAALKGTQHIDRTAKSKLAPLAIKLDGLCASLSAYYQSQATRWSERRREINQQAK